MRIRLQFGPGARIAQRVSRDPDLALAVSVLMTPAAVLAGVLGLWGIAADLKWAGDFAISSGFFSHWQVWLAGAALLQLASRMLRRYALIRQSSRRVRAT